MRRFIVSLALYSVFSLYLQGCASFRQELGWHYGEKDYKAMQTTNKVPVGFGAGYVRGMSFYKSMDEMEEGTKRLRKLMKDTEERMEEENRRLRMEIGR